MASKRLSSDFCLAEPCVISEKSKVRDKRIIMCSSPGCLKRFHAACVGQARMSDKELNELFFVCLRCEEYIKYSSQIAQKSLMAEFDSKLSALKLAIHQSIDEKISSASAKILEQTNSMFDSFSKQFEGKLNFIKQEAAESKEFLLGLMKDKDKKIDALHADIAKLKTRCMEEVGGVKTVCDSMAGQITSLEMKKRKKSFIVKNFPERPCKIDEVEISSCQEGITAISRALDLSTEIPNIRETFRLGKPRMDGKPRLMMVRTTEKTARLFLNKSRRLKEAAWPLNKVFLQEDLPREVNRKLASMRKRAYDHRSSHPGDEAFVKNKKLFINGTVVDEIDQDF